MSAGTLAVARAVGWRTTHNFTRNPQLLVPTLVFPLFFFTAFAGGLSQVSNTPGFEFEGNYTAFQFCFVLLQAAAFSGVFTGFAIARDFEGGFGKRLLLGASHRMGVVLGYAFAALARWAMVATFLTVIALAAGMDVGGGPVDLLGMYSLAVVLNVAGFMWACGIALRFRTVQAGPLMQVPVFLLLFVTPVYVPLELLDGWIHTAATINPATYVLEAVRSLVTGRASRVLLAFGLGGGLAASLCVFALRGLRRAETEPS